ncbi:MAG: molybdenum cofactor carrier [Candidatus Dadabacteria bacterium]|nr:MAG: molybdenum cofactor carrier [Candidatus Dadabacteria bacterium]
MLSNLKLVSGGQTGVDRAALDFALKHGIPAGGWCPKGRLAEDGVIDEKYPLKETSSSSVDQRTEWNIRDSDGTLVITFEDEEKKPTDGTVLTVELAKKYNKPLFVINLAKGNIDVNGFKSWIKKNQIKTLNVAGPRESFMPGCVYKRAYQCLAILFAQYKE